MRRRRSFPASAGSLREARGFVTDMISGASQELLETVGIMVSELATNAQLHAATGFEVLADYSRHKGRLRVEVTDTGAGEPTVRRPHPNDPHGRGLQIVAMLSDNWGIDWPSDQPDTPGKTVWFELAVSPPEPGEEAASQRRVAARSARAGGVTPRGPTVHESPDVTVSVSVQPDVPGPATSVLVHRCPRGVSRGVATSCSGASPLAVRGCRH